MATKHWEQNKDATVYVGNIDERFTQELLAELMTQMGPVRQVHMPQDRVSQTHQGYGFVEFDTAGSADYAAKVLNGVRVWGKPLRVNKASADKQKAVDIGAELFVNNLDAQVDEKILYDTFGQFGGILRQPNIVRDDNNVSKGYGFVSFGSFEASDAAIMNMNGQYLLSKQITVEYAYKKDGKGERHGDEAERKLAAEGKKHNVVPEQQTLPAAYHMTGPAPATSANAAPLGNGSGSGGGGGGGSGGPQGFNDQNHAGGPSPIAGGPPVPGPPAIPAGFGGPPPMGGRGGPPVPPFNGIPPPGGMGRPPQVLPPAPSGLPARPPPSQIPFQPPVGDFHPGGPPGFRGSPAQGMPFPVPGMPPPGFPGAPNGAPPPPPGFVPPPGFGPPPGAPNGFVRR